MDVMESISSDSGSQLRNEENASHTSDPIQVIEMDEDVESITVSCCQPEAFASGAESPETNILLSLQCPDSFPTEMSDTPEWFKFFYNQYQKNENRKLILMREMHLEMIDYEIRKCELLKDIIRKMHE